MERIRVSVRQLVEYALESGDLSASGGFASARQLQLRAVEGTRGHAAVRRALGDDWEWERPVALELPFDDLCLRVEGRLDGLRHHPTGEAEILEIKTFTGPPELLSGENQLHWAQAMVYAAMLAQLGLVPTEGEITITLCYLHLPDRERRFFSRSYGFDALLSHFVACVECWLKREHLLHSWRMQRNRQLEALPFPFPDYRPGQRLLAGAVYRSLRQGAQWQAEPLLAAALQERIAPLSPEPDAPETASAQTAEAPEVICSAHLFVQAPTGIGKTAATLYPALRALGEGHCNRIFYLTARTVTRVAAEEALERMRAQGLACKSLTLAPKDQLCVLEEPRCDPEFCPRAAGHYDRVKEALFDIFAAHDAFGPPLLREYADRYRVCPFEYALDLSLWCDVVIGDYNHLFDPVVYLRRFFSEERGEHAVLLDEAHNLVDRAREMYSSTLHKQPFLDIPKLLKAEAALRPQDRKAFEQLRKSMNKINRYFTGLRKSLTEEGDSLVRSDGPVRAEATSPSELVQLNESFMDAAETLLALPLPALEAESTHQEARKALLEQYFESLSFRYAAEQFDERYITLSWLGDAQGLERASSGRSPLQSRDVSLRLYCMDPSPQLRLHMDKGRAAVLFSATLSPLNYYIRLLGGHTGAGELRLPSPFPPERLCLLVQDGISTRYNDRARTLPQVAEAIYEMASAHKGNYIAYFPSHRYLADTLALLQPRAEAAGWRTLAQEGGMSPEAREAFLAAFDADNPDTLLGFAVMGGIFGEGIDLVGERLSGVAVVGVGLPQLCLERDTIRAHFGAEGFEYAYRIPGMNKVLQAVGRVIRTETDRGVALLIDSRFAQPPTRSLFPPEWRPRRVRNEDILPTLTRFWETH